jgi:flavodoxin
MKAFVVYESLWGNTAAVARAIAEGIGPEARALTTDEASADLVETADLIVAGAPVLGFNLPTDSIRDNVARTEIDAPTPPDVSHPSMRSWLESLPRGQAPSAAFETRIWWSPRGATGAIEDRLERAGYRPIAKAQKFVVEGKYGPLRDGELERAREWGSTLAQVIADQGKIAVGAGRG